MTFRDAVLAELDAEGALIISDGSLRWDYTMPRALDLLSALDPETGERLSADWSELSSQDIDDIDVAEQISWLWEEICDAIDYALPDGYWFGAHPGDGACFGVWRVAPIDRKAEIYDDAVAWEIIDVARQAYNWLEMATRADGSVYVRQVNRAPSWMTRIMMAVHHNGEMLPDDYVYRWVYEYLAMIADMSEGDSLDDLSSSIDVDNDDMSSLLAWVGSNAYRVSYVDTIISDGDANSLSDALIAAQLSEKVSIFWDLIDALRDFVLNGEYTPRG